MKRVRGVYHCNVADDLAPIAIAPAWYFSPYWYGMA
jgi:hypothetical protein